MLPVRVDLEQVLRRSNVALVDDWGTQRRERWQVLSFRLDFEVEAPPFECGPGR